MKTLIVSYNYRNLDNLSNILDIILQDGGEVKLMLFPILIDPSHTKMGQFSFPVVLNRPISCHSMASMNPWELFQILREVFQSYQPDLIILDDLYNYPSHWVHKLLQLLFFLKRKLSKRPPVVAFQHGLYQIWSKYNRNFACDYFITFGNAHKRQFKPQLQNRVKVGGLSKLDRLKNVTVSDGQYILFIAQNSPSPQALQQGLEDLSRYTNLPVWIKPHPQHVWYYQSLKSDCITYLSVETDIIDLIANASFVVTTGSTSGIEALLLGKRLVVVPSSSSSPYANELFLTRDYSAEEMQRVLDVQTQRPDDVRAYLEDVIGNLNFTSAQKTYEILKSIVATGV